MGFRHDRASAGRSHEPLARGAHGAGPARTVLAGLVAVATLATGGLVASTAYAGGAGDNRPGGATGGLPAGMFWQYKDDASGSFGPAANADGSPRIESVEAAYKRAGVSVVNDGVYDGPAAIRDTLRGALSKCVAGFRQRHPGEGDGDCRVVGVGSVAGQQGGRWVYNGSGGYSASKWYSSWDSQIKPYTYNYAGTQSYRTSDGFDDDPSTSVDKIAYDNIARAGATPNLIIIVLDKYQPKPPETPPAPPTKKVEQGTSADGMSNETVISTGTGVGGKRMVVQDAIDPNGMAYKVTGQKVTDATTGQDVSAKFTFNTADGQPAPNNVATATWKGGDLPEKHTFEYRLTITVSLPSTSKVADTPSVTWNDKGTGKADGHGFPTWQPNPDKSWILYRDGKWQAVVDPGETNRTGADDMKFLDGDTVGSAVNGTVDPGLKEAPSKLELTDDWAAADYLVDPQDASKIRVFAAEAEPDRTDTVDGATVKHYTRTSVADIANKGTDVTDMFDIKVEGTVATATAKPDYLKTLKGMRKGLQLTLLVPFTVNFADGKGAARVREDFGRQPGDEVTFCTSPDGKELTNKGSQTVNGQTEPTNKPKICGYVPPVRKDVIAESSQGGGQESVDGKVVHPGQKVEYQLTTEPKLPADLATMVTSVAFTDQYDENLVPDKQTVEMMDLNTGKVVPKSKYATRWDEGRHLFQLTVKDQSLIGQWRASSSPRVQIRFEGTVREDAPADHKIGNKWVLTLNNSLTPSNEVFNLPPVFNPSKKDTQSKEQGDPTVSIDGKTMLLGDTGHYTIDLDATQKDQAYKVWRLGLTDDFDDEYVSIDPSRIEITGDDGKDYTNAFNIQVRDGVAYAYAKTVDTEIPATGETVKGDPQPTDLKAYAGKSDKDHDPLKDPAIDQSLLGQHYAVTLPYTVVKVTDGYVVKNTAVQIVNNVRKKTNTVSNPLKPINPKKDVTVKVGGHSVDGRSVYLDSTFLYQLDSSILPADRAYQKIANWGITDQLDPAYDKATGQWAVYAARDLYRGGEAIARKGERIAGSGFDSSKLGGDMFTANIDPSTGLVDIQATQAYLDLVSADDAHEQGWRAYVQVTRVKVTDRHENVFTEHVNGKDLTSNIVWTRTPDLTPGIKLEKWDRRSGWPKGDRDDSKDALDGAKDGDVIVFTITNTSKDEDGHGAWFKASDLKLEDHTIVGDGEVKDLKYPDNWSTLVLKPGQSVEVTGTLTGFTKDRHTDRAKVTGTPLVECPVVDKDPFGDASGKPSTGGEAGDGDGPRQVTVGDRTLCEDTPVESNTDDWNGRRSLLGETGSAILPVGVGALLMAGLGAAVVMVRRRKSAHDDTDAALMPRHAA